MRERAVIALIVVSCIFVFWRKNMKERHFCVVSINLILVFQTQAYSQKPGREFSYLDIYNFVDTPWRGKFICSFSVYCVLDSKCTGDWEVVKMSHFSETLGPETCCTTSQQWGCAPLGQGPRAWVDVSSRGCQDSQQNDPCRKSGPVRGGQEGRSQGFVLVDRRISSGLDCKNKIFNGNFEGQDQMSDIRQKWNFNLVEVKWFGIYTGKV